MCTIKKSYFKSSKQLTYIRIDIKHYFHIIKLRTAAITSQLN